MRIGSGGGAIVVSVRTILGVLACLPLRPTGSAAFWYVARTGVVAVDIVLLTVMILARRPSPLGRRMSGDGGDGERLSESHPFGAVLADACEMTLGRTKMLVMAATRFLICFDGGSALKTLDAVSLGAIDLVSTVSCAELGASEELAPEEIRDRRRVKKDMSGPRTERVTMSER